MSEKNQSKIAEAKYNKNHLYNTASPPKVSVDLKPRTNDVRINKIRTFSRKNSSKIMKFNCNNSSHFDVNSERRKKQFELQKVYNSTSVNINYSFKSANKAKAILDNRNSFKEFCALLERQLDILESSGYNALNEYLDILKQISQRDESYGNFLNRVIKGINSALRIKDLNEISNESIKIYSIPSKISLSEQELMGTDKELTETKNKLLNKNMLNTDYIQQRPKNLENFTEHVQASENEINRLKNTIKELQQQIEKHKTKEVKFESLLKAMKDRGYQVEQIYATDVLSLENKKEEAEGFLYLNENLISLSSDVSEDF